jgi:stearoyl-CoA desaturase (delta-9 desaturase)
VTAILLFLAGHWLASIFVQTFFLHRYGSHKQLTMSKGWERFFYLFTFVAQGASFLSPRAYAILHREHHAYSDSERDPHSPHQHKNVVSMMWHTAVRYTGLLRGTIVPEARFAKDVPTWPALDRFADTWTARLGFGALYTLFYVVFAPHWAFYLLLPLHFLIGPIQGAIVNWCGHKYGYRNFASSGDESRNTIPFDFITGGELFQNNHHKYPMSPNFAARWFEIDPTYLVIRMLAALKIVKLGPQRMRLEANRPPAPAPRDLLDVKRAASA